MTNPERVTVAETLDLQRATLELVKSALGEMSEARQEIKDFRHEIVDVVKDINLRVDKLETAHELDVAKAAAIGAVEGHRKIEAEHRWKRAGQLFALLAAAAATGASLFGMAQALGIFH